MKIEDLAMKLRIRVLPRLLRARPRREHAQIRRVVQQLSDEDVIAAYTTCHVCGDAPPKQVVASAIARASDDDDFLRLMRESAHC